MLIIQWSIWISISGRKQEEMLSIIEQLTKETYKYVNRRAIEESILWDLNKFRLMNRQKLSDSIREQQSGTRSYSLSPLSKEEEVECETGWASNEYNRAINLYNLQNYIS